MKNKKVLKADKIRAYLKINPRASSTQVSRVVGVSQGYAHKIVQEESMKRKQAKVVQEHVTEATQQVRKKKPSIFKRIWDRIRSLFRKLFGLVGSLFKKLFGFDDDDSSSGGSSNPRGGFPSRNMEEEQNVNLK